MRINVLGRREIERVVWFSAPTAVISITDPTARGFNDDGNEAKIASNAIAILRLRFWDCDPESLERNFDEWTSREAESWNIPSARAFVDQQIANAMKPEHADRIIAFVRQHSYLDSLVIHCEAGISRSAGVAAALVAIEPTMRWENEDRGGYRPNAHVKSLVIAAARGAKVSP